VLVDVPQLPMVLLQDRKSVLSPLGVQDRRRNAHSEDKYNIDIIEI
jgi:hypothetical protein